jgi:sortase (surface protein transpeptidase)
MEMKELDIFLFLVGIVSVAIVVLAFFVPVFLLMIYRSIEETRNLMRELLQEVKMMNYLKPEEGEKRTSFSKVNPEKKEELSKLCEIFLELSSEKPDVELVVTDGENEKSRKEDQGNERERTCERSS